MAPTDHPASPTRPSRRSLLGRASLLEGMVVYYLNCLISWFELGGRVVRVQQTVCQVTLSNATTDLKAKQVAWRLSGLREITNKH